MFHSHGARKGSAFGAYITLHVTLYKVFPLLVATLIAKATTSNKAKNLFRHYCQYIFFLPLTKGHPF